MRVSVALPVFNKAAFLGECLDSLLGQTWGDLEIIAVDDRSRDGSLEVLRACTDPRLRVIALEANVGPAGAAQRAMDAARGEYIVRADADDVMMPDRIAEQVAFMDARPELGASGAWMEILGQPGTVRRAEADDADCRAGSLFRIPMYQPATIYRREVLLRHGLRYADAWPRYGEDWRFQLRLMEAARVGNLPKPLVRYRLGAHNTAASMDVHEGLRAVYADVLQWHGLPCGAEQLAPHLHLAGAFPAPVRAADIAAAKRYLRALRRAARATGRFDEAALERALRKAWDGLAFQLPRFGLGPALAYVLRDAHPAWAKWRYLASSFIKGRAYRPATERIRPAESLP